MKSKTLWIVLGSLGGVFLLCAGICGGSLLWFSRFPSVNATSQELFDYSNFEVPKFPQPKSETDVESGPRGARMREVVLGNGTGGGGVPGTNGVLWAYSPEIKEKGAKVPCVLVAPAGSTLLEGMALSDGDVMEHLPYLHAGFAVVAFSLDGVSRSDPPDSLAYQEFHISAAGLVNARNALEYALTQMPEVDSKRIFIAGHSSAGTLALLFAEHESRLAGCVAYAPCSDFKARLPVPMVRMFSAKLKYLPEFIVRSSPRTHEADLKCPVMVFHAADDSNVPVQESRDFVSRVKAAGKDITLVEVATGDHYDSMIQEGIPKGIEWMKRQR